MIGEAAEHTPQLDDVRVTVAIPTRERPIRLVQAVGDIWAGSRRPDELLIVCQGEGAMEIARRLVEEVPGVESALRFYASSRNGQNASLNDLVRLARGEFIALTDDDMRLPSDWLARMLEVWGNDWEAGDLIVTGPIDVPESVTNPRATPGYRPGEDRRVWRELPLVGDTLYGGHFGAPRSLFERLSAPPFDERFGPGTRFPGAGDTELARRALAKGMPIVFDPGVRATHLADPSSWIRSQHLHSIGDGAMFAVRASEGEPGMFGVAVRTLAAVTAKGLHNLAMLRVREGAGRLYGAVGLIRGAWRWWRGDEKHEPRTRVPAPDELRLVELA
jgi:hypothetical protein